ncbi:hypothetical protein IPJ91_00880 [bacterium]|nr:MAG: hypothetical protein IPJ91_00880 [bacterium]
MLVFQVIPTYNAIRTEQSSKKLYENQVVEYRKDIRSIQSNQVGDITYALNLLNRWIPTNSGTVSVVKEEFDSLVSSYHLQLEDFRAGESITKASKDFLEDLNVEFNNDLMRNVPIELKVKGNVEDVFVLLDKIQHYTTFNMVKLVRLSKEADVWTGSILILRVNFSESFELNKENFIGNIIDEDVVKGIRERAIVN